MSGVPILGKPEPPAPPLHPQQFVTSVTPTPRFSRIALPAAPKSPVGGDQWGYHQVGSLHAMGLVGGGVVKGSRKGREGTDSQDRTPSLFRGAAGLLNPQPDLHLGRGCQGQGGLWVTRAKEEGGCAGVRFLRPHSPRPDNLGTGKNLLRALSSPRPPGAVQLAERSAKSRRRAFLLCCYAQCPF